MSMQPAPRDPMPRAYLAARLAVWLGVLTAQFGRTGIRLATRRAGRNALADTLTRSLIRLGLTFVKGGQLLSTRSDLLPPEWCAVLGRLHDRVGPMSPADLDQALAQAYPGGAGWPFADLDRAASGSGSIACVYRGRLFDGRVVAVKVRRPHISQRMAADFRLISAGAGFGQRLPGLRKVPLRRMVDEVAGAALRQLDLTGEGRALSLLRENLAGHMQVPEPIPAAGGEGVLIMSWVNGLERFAPGELTRERRREIVRRILQGVYRMLSIDGLVHCDMHPGNLYLTREGEVVLLDAGFVVQLPETVRRLFAEFFLDMATGRGDACADVVLASASHVPPGSDLAAFRTGIRELVAVSHRQTAREFRLAPFATRLFDLQRRHGIAAAPEFVFPLLSLLVLEGMVNEFDVDVDFQAEAIPTLLTALRR